MGLKRRPEGAEKSLKSRATCVGCPKEITDEDSVVEIRVGKLRARPRRAKFQPDRRWGLMHERCFAMTMGVSEV